MLDLSLQSKTDNSFERVFFSTVTGNEEAQFRTHVIPDNVDVDLSFKIATNESTNTVSLIAGEDIDNEPWFYLSGNNGFIVCRFPNGDGSYDFLIPPTPINNNQVNHVHYSRRSDTHTLTANGVTATIIKENVTLKIAKLFGSQTGFGLVCTFYDFIISVDGFETISYLFNTSDGVIYDDNAVSQPNLLSNSDFMQRVIEWRGGDDLIQSVNVLNKQVIELEYTVLESNNIDGLLLSANSFCGHVDMPHEVGTHIIAIIVVDETKPLIISAENNSIKLGNINAKLLKNAGHLKSANSNNFETFRKNGLNGYLSTKYLIKSDFDYSFFIDEYAEATNGTEFILVDGWHVVSCKAIAVNQTSNIEKNNVFMKGFRYQFDGDVVVEQGQISGFIGYGLQLISSFDQANGRYIVKFNALNSGSLVLSSNEFTGSLDNLFLRRILEASIG